MNMLYIQFRSSFQPLISINYVNKYLNNQTCSCHGWNTVRLRNFQCNIDIPTHRYWSALYLQLFFTFDRYTVILTTKES